MSTLQNKQLVEQMFSDVMNNRRFDRISDIIAPNYMNHSMPMPQPGPEGMAAILKMFEDGFPDMKITLDTVIAEGETVATRGYWTGTHRGAFMGIPATGKKVNIGFMDFWKFENGKATENWVQMDNMAIMQQLGVIEQPA